MLNRLVYDMLFTGEQYRMKFEWDEHKNFVNKEKHKISFETAAHVFDDPNYIEMYDFEHSTDEL